MGGAAMKGIIQWRRINDERDLAIGSFSGLGVAWGWASEVACVVAGGPMGSVGAMDIEV